MKINKLNSANFSLLLSTLVLTSACVTGCCSKPKHVADATATATAASASASASTSTPATAESETKAGSVNRAAYKIEKRDGLTLVQISTKDADGKDLLSLTVAPEAGSNIVSIVYKGTEVLEQPVSMKDVAKQDAGIEFLYPTPNRVANAELNYKNLKLKFTPNLGPHFIHGLARQYPWTFEEPKFDGDKVVYKTSFTADEKTDFYKQFPVKNKIEMVITLDGDRAQFEFNVTNLDQRSLPFGVGIHPYFHLNGTRANSSVQMHVSNMMDAVDLIPNGKVIPLKKTKYAKLPTGMTIENVLGADTVFWPTTASAQVFEPTFKFEIAASKDFGHTVLWAPPTRELFAVENQTSSTDAHNLARKGFKKESGLLELGAGKKWTGWVKYSFSGK